ncbi:MAG: indolepyruvate oxidoreductase subunit beta [Planctomycetes bacterium]|nr:indolepyruvate oxidoreductase subunit beta [Planctomycetota bacterium]
MSDTLRILFVGVGGQGVLSAARLLGEAALELGLDVKVGQLHGMAQRGGSVESTVVIGPGSTATIDAGEADIIVAFEPIEALRAIPRLKKDSTILVNLSEIMPFSLTSGGKNYPESAELLGKLKQSSSKVITLDALETANSAGNAKTINSVMLGALAATNILPLSAEALGETVSSLVPQKTKAVNAKAFEAGMKSV